jgi:hypothetical protein
MLWQASQRLGWIRRLGRVLPSICAQELRHPAGWSVHRPIVAATAPSWGRTGLCAPDPVGRSAPWSIHRPVRPRTSRRDRGGATNRAGRSTHRPPAHLRSCAPGRRQRPVRQRRASNASTCWPYETAAWQYAAVRRSWAKGQVGLSSGVRRRIRSLRTVLDPEGRPWSMAVSGRRWRVRLPHSRSHRGLLRCDDLCRAYACR